VVAASLIFKIVHASEWAGAQEAQVYYGSAKDKADGFLHLSTATQLRETLERYYAGVNDLVLVAVDSEAVANDLKWEHAPSRGEDFPHLFAPLPLAAVMWARPLQHDDDRNPVLPPLT
jgi:uncharacterized protein (DUF952 family)